MKKRKTNKNTKRYIKKLAKRELNRKDKVWRQEALKEFNYKCAYCVNINSLHNTETPPEIREVIRKLLPDDNKPKKVIGLDIHHLLPRQLKQFRHEPTNSIVLCKKHHRFSFILSAHQNSLLFYCWYKITYPARWQRLLSLVSKSDYPWITDILVNLRA